MMKSKRQETSNLLRSLKSFPPFRVSATEYEDGTIEGKVTFMKHEFKDNNKYLTKKEFYLHIDEFNAHRQEFNAHRQEFNAHRQEFNEFRIETNNKFEELKQLIINKL